jgi:hypothetical protein
VRVGDPNEVVYRRAPLRNEDASYVLKDLLGYSDEEVDGLTSEGAFGVETAES